MRIDLAGKLLSYCIEADLSVAELTGKMRGSHDRTMQLIKELKAHALLRIEASESRRVGRPRQYLRATPIGEQFVKEYDNLLSLPLRSNLNDIKKAVHQAELARRLVESGISPYARLEEVNQLARNIAATAKTKQRAR